MRQDLDMALRWNTSTIKTPAFRRTSFWYMAIVVFLTAYGCTKEGDGKLFTPVKPPHFPKVAPWAEGLLITQGQVNLGRELFNDPILSLNGNVSCASCHKTAHAFSDSPMPFSLGSTGEFGARNTPDLSNLLWRPAFMWDGGINHLEIMPVAPITHPKEHALTMSDWVEKIIAAGYEPFFNQVFGTDSITSAQTLKALQAYMVTLQSSQAPIDAIWTGVQAMPEDSKKGALRFERDCGSCHVGPLGSDFSYGQHDATSSDSGRYVITRKSEDIGMFRTPSLRNNGFTSPYGHAGQWATLEAAIQAFYQPRGMTITEEELIELTTYLSLWNDSTFIQPR